MKSIFLNRWFRFVAVGFLLWASASSLGAQNVLFRVGGGFASHYGPAKVVGAYKIGIGYEWEFDQHWSVTPSLNLYGKGWRQPDRPVRVLDEEGNQVFDEETGEPVVGVKSQRTSANYLELPVMFSYYLRLAPSRYVVFSAGPYVACGLFGKQETKGDTERPGAEKMFYEHQTFGRAGVRRMDAGLQVFSGYQFPAGVCIGVEADFGFIPTRKNGEKNVSALISLSYKL